MGRISGRGMRAHAERAALMSKRRGAGGLWFLGLWLFRMLP